MGLDSCPKLPFFVLFWLNLPRNLSLNRQHTLTTQWLPATDGFTGGERNGRGVAGQALTGFAAFAPLHLFLNCLSKVLTAS
jgi:hypothetical protein